MTMVLPFTITIIATACNSRFVDAFSPPLQQYHATRRRQTTFFHSASMQPIAELADDDLIALPFDGFLTSTTTSSSSHDEETEAEKLQLRLCVIRNQQYIYPLIRHEDDVETDLFLDPRSIENEISLQDVLQWWNSNSNEEEVTISEVQYYGVGWYGQRPVPSLGGGPGYGAEADEIWSIEEDVLEQLLSVDGVDLPVIDVGMAHGEKARGGALF